MILEVVEFEVEVEVGELFELGITPSETSMLARFKYTAMSFLVPAIFLNIRASPLLVIYALEIESPIIGLKRFIRSLVEPLPDTVRDPKVSQSG